MTTAIVIFVIALMLSALFSGYETGFISANPIRVNYLASEESNSLARRLQRYMGRPEQPLTTLLIANNIVNIAATVIVAQEAHHYFGEAWGDLVSWLIITPVILIFGEIVPKSIFRTHPTRLAMRMVPFLEVTYAVLWPVAMPLTFITSKLTGVFGEKRAMNPVMSSLEDVRVLVDESAEQGTIKREEQQMIHSIIDLQNTQAQEIMVPRINIQALPKTANREELLDLFETSGLTRIPVYNESIDEIIGVVNIYDVLLDPNGGDHSIDRYIRDVRHVPDTMKVDDLLNELKASKRHLAIVVDEYGGTHGLISLEDILEEIFGEIQDEHDREESRIQPVGPNAYVVDARLSLEEAALAMNVDLKDEFVDSVGGWLMHIAGRIPAQGEIIEHGPFRVTVLNGGTNYVSRVRIDVQPEARRDHDA